jgi:hypothetical protein
MADTDTHGNAAEKNLAKLEALEERRLAKFEEGLKKMPDLDYDEVDGDLSTNMDAYQHDQHSNLKRIMAEAEAKKPMPKDGKLKPSDIQIEE